MTSLFTTNHGRELLKLWQDYYDYRPRDSLSLEFTTKITFRLWIDTVNDIVAHTDYEHKMSTY